MPQETAQRRADSAENPCSDVGAVCDTDPATSAPWQALWPSGRLHCPCGQPKMYVFERFLRCRGCGVLVCSRKCLWAHKKQCHA